MSRRGRQPLGVVVSFFRLLKSFHLLSLRKQFTERIIHYRGARDGSCGESAIQVVNFRKWDWYFPGVYVKPDSFFIFGLRFMNSDCTPTTMEWKTIYNQATEDCKPYYTDREWFRASVKFYTDYVIIGDSKYQKIKIERAPSHLKRLKNLVTSDLKN